MPKFNDWTGTRIGRLVVVHKLESVRKPSGVPVIMWKVKCDCGKEISKSVSRLWSLLNDPSKVEASCGCALKEKWKKSGFKNWLGERVGKLVVIEHLPQRGMPGARRHVWKARCDCGKEIAIEAGNLASALKTKRRSETSCGCARDELTAKISTTHGFTSGGRQRGEYQSWSKMIQRCRNPKCKEYEWYGAKNIKVCDRWMSFENFYADMGDKPEPAKDYSIDRWPDPKGDYKPGNCRWATDKEQSLNTTRTIRVMYRGESRVLAELADEVGLSRSIVYQRIVKLGWDIEEALNHERGNEALLEMDGEKLPINKWAKKYGIDPMLLYQRLHNGWSLKDAVNANIGRRRGAKLFSINGEEKSLVEWAKIYGVSANLVRDRVRGKWRILDALTLPIGAKPEKYEIDIDETKAPV